MINPTQGLGVTPEVRDALAVFWATLSDAYGSRLVDAFVFGSRARGEAREDSDVDVGIVLAGEIDNRVRERMRIAGLAYDAIVETGVHVQGWPVTEVEWKSPGRSLNPDLLNEMKRDRVPLATLIDAPAPR